MQIISSRPTSSQSDTEKDEDFEVDWVLLYDFKDIELHHAIDEYHTLIRDIEAFGLETEVRHGYGTAVLVLVRIPRNKLGNEVYRSRVKDWLFGIVHVRPLGDSSTVVDAETPSEEIRSIFHLVTWTKEQGGAGVTANFGQWEHITASFAPHAWSANKRLLKQLAAKTVLGMDDLDQIKALFGEKVAFYYAFIQAYSLFLIAPATCGSLFWLFSTPYSVSFGVLTCIWGIVFVEWWKRQETDLSIRWNVKGVGALKVNRVQYDWEREEIDPVTAEVRKIFPAHKRLMRQLLFLPFAALAGLALGGMLVVTFFIEAIISDVYGSQLKEYWAVQYLPTIILAISLPYITDALTLVAKRLSEHENHRTNDEYELAQVQKAFILNFVTSFLPLILTAYIYVPYGSKLLPKLMPNSWQSHISVSDFRIDTHRLQEEVISLSMAGQFMNFGEEFILPYLKRRLSALHRAYQESKEATSLHQRMHSEFTKTLLVDAPQEHSLLSRLRSEADAEPYDVQEDIMEMCVQFGYLAMFGVVYPLMPLGFLINNWIELRGDFFKLIHECQRPPPIRSDSIGPSVSALEFLTWLGTLSTAALVHMYSGDFSQVRLSRLLLTIFLAEQAYLATKLTVRFMFDKIGSEAVRKEEASRRLVRKRYLETFSEEAAGTSRRQRAHTYTGHKRSAPTTPTEAEKRELFPIYEVEESVETRQEYRTEKAERFWNERKETMCTADAGVRLIVALKGMQASNNAEGADKSKWI
ncbi:putative plasma membrane stress response protein [Aureobasidium pullulans]|uniref:Plasma membrane stress response protein n=1 Tax=Aureobasidium pullulans TaxID=5580 RepID=A0AB74IS76_AURPU|nr:putative plasma membrane stress response protein [Aureobasidium pullulans]